MTKKIYKTAQGKTIDMGALMLRNENVRAVGNMKTNARGDVLDANNNVAQTRNQQTVQQYNQQVKPRGQ